MKSFISFFLGIFFASGLLAQEWIVRFHEPSEITVPELPTQEWRRVEVLSAQMNIYLYECVQGYSIDEQYELLLQYPQIRAFEPNRKIESRASAKLPNDNNFNDNAQWNMYKIQAPEAWYITEGDSTKTGDDIVIAVIDESFDIDHIDLDFYEYPYEIAGNGIDDDNNGYIDDINGWNAYDDTGWVSEKNAFGIIDAHGTSVSSLAAGLGNNGIGIAGVSWRTKVLPVQGSTSNESVVIKAYDYVLTQRKRYNNTNGDSGVYVVAANSSFGVNNGKPGDYPVWCSLYDDLGQAGIISTAATANGFFDVDIQGDIPTTCPSDYLIGVTSSNRNDKIAANSAFGTESIEFAAPGQDVFVASFADQFRSDFGTSFAAPHLAGAVALMYSAVDAITYDSLKQQGGDVLADYVLSYLLNFGYDALPSLDGLVQNSRRLNVYQAVESIAEKRLLTSTQELTPANSNFSVFPVPAQGELFIESSEDLRKVSIHQLNGQCVKSISVLNNVIDVSDVPNGMYILTVDFKNITTTPRQTLIQIAR